MTKYAINKQRQENYEFTTGYSMRKSDRRTGKSLSMAFCFMAKAMEFPSDRILLKDHHSDKKEVVRICIVNEIHNIVKKMGLRGFSITEEGNRFFLTYNVYEPLTRSINGEILWSQGLSWILKQRRKQMVSYGIYF